MKSILAFGLMYLITPFALHSLINFLGTYMKQIIFGRRKSSTAIRKNEEPKRSINSKLSKRLSFTRKDPRKKPIPFKTVFFIIYLSGLTLAFLAGWKAEFKLFLLSIIVAYISFSFSILSSNKIVNSREQVLNRMLELKSVKMRLANRDKNTRPNIDNEIKVLQWGQDLVSPMKLEIYMPTDFDSLQVDGFLESFNLVFNNNGVWITDQESGGFDFNAGIAHLRVSPKLPSMAAWHERYLDPKDIHWSFFPLALGSENGVPVFNESTGKTERVLGFAVNSGQEKLMSSKGIATSSDLTSSPQSLVAGGTGGGKSLSLETEVEVYK